MSMFDWFKCKKEVLPEILYEIVDEEVELDKFVYSILIELKNGSKFEYELFIMNHCQYNTVSMNTGENSNIIRISNNKYDYTHKYLNVAYFSSIDDYQVPRINGNFTNFKIIDKEYTIQSSDINYITKEIKKVGTHKLINKVVKKIKKE